MSFDDCQFNDPMITRLPTAVSANLLIIRLSQLRYNQPYHLIKIVILIYECSFIQFKIQIDKHKQFDERIQIHLTTNHRQTPAVKQNMS